MKKKQQNGRKTKTDLFIKPHIKAYKEGPKTFVSSAKLFNLKN